VGDEPPVSDVTDVWCQPRPVSIYFQPAEAKYQTWLLLLSLCHHIKGFTEEFLSVLADFDAPPSLGGRTAAKQWFVNRIHFLRALLENRSTHLISQNTTLMGAAVVNRLTKHDGGNKRMSEHVNTVEFLENLGKRILSATAFEQFQSKKQQGFEDHYVQAPLGVIDEAKIFLAASPQRNYCLRSESVSSHHHHNKSHHHHPQKWPNKVSINTILYTLLMQ